MKVRQGLGLEPLESRRLLSVTAMTTWGGDANLDGKINIDDYGRIDGNAGQSDSVFGWFNGSFNYEGKINIDDYGIIDGNINRQGNPFAVLPEVNVRVRDAAAYEDGPVTRFFYLRRSGDLSQPLTVNYVIGGKAKQGSDYNLVGSAVTIKAGTHLRRIEVTPISDGIDGPNKSVTLTLAGGDYSIDPFDPAATIRIVSSKNTAGQVTSGGDLISIGSSGKLDLTDNKLVTQSNVGTWTGSAYDGITGLVDSAGNALWDGSTGIVGVAKVSEVRILADTATTIFAGQTVLGSDTIAMVTWGGDANLDGKINIDDYGRIDGNVGRSGGIFGWANGDFNYDGRINIDDYAIIDANR